MINFLKKIFAPKKAREETTIQDFLNFARSKGASEELLYLNSLEEILKLKSEEREFHKNAKDQDRHNKAIVEVFEILLANEDIKLDTEEQIDELIEFLKKKKYT